MSSINDKMQNPGGTGLSLSPANIRKAGTDIRALGKALGMDTMQVLIYGLHQVPHLLEGDG